jgi:hypothetical protein
MLRSIAARRARRVLLPAKRAAMRCAPPQDEDDYGYNRPGAKVSGVCEKGQTHRIYKLIEYEGGPHGVCTTEKDRISADSLSFLKSQASLPDLGTLIADGSLGHTLYIEGS